MINSEEPRAETLELLEENTLWAGCVAAGWSQAKGQLHSKF